MKTVLKAYMGQKARRKHEFTQGVVKGRGSGSVDVAWLTEVEMMAEDTKLYRCKCRIYMGLA